MVAQVYFLRDGSVVLNDEHGLPIPQFERNLLREFLLELREAGVVDDETPVWIDYQIFRVRDILPV